MSIIRVTILILLFLPCYSNLSYANQGVLVSSEEHRKQQIEKNIEEYSQSIVLQTLIKTVGEVMGRAFQQNGENILPAFAYQASHQAALECFKQWSMKEILQDAFVQSYDRARGQFRDGIDGAVIQRGIKDKVDQIVKPMVQEPIFRKIIEHYARQTIIQQRRFIAEQSIKRQIQLATIQQQVLEQALRQQIEQQYQAALQQSQSQ